MKIIFIGAGNLATNMAVHLFKNNCDILQIYSRTSTSAQLLASQVDAEAITTLANIRDDADYYIFSVKDSVLADLVIKMPHQNGVWIHTAGSMPLEVFEGKTQNYGVLYPLQTFSKEKNVHWLNIPLFIESSDIYTHAEIKRIANLLSNNIYALSTEKRKYVHASGVYANNFVNQMYELAYQMIQKAELPFDILLPIIEETCDKVHSLSPLEAQTGPAIRHDENVMNKHIQLLDSDTEKQLYKIVSESIHNSHKQK